jgi:hypothetical protein
MLAWTSDILLDSVGDAVGANVGPSVGDKVGPPVGLLNVGDKVGSTELWAKLLDPWSVYSFSTKRIICTHFFLFQDIYIYINIYI